MFSDKAPDYTASAWLDILASSSEIRSSKPLLVKFRDQVLIVCVEALLLDKDLSVKFIALHF